MKKTVKFTLVVCLVLLMSLFTFTACSDSEPIVTTTTLSSLECRNELQKIYENSIEHKSWLYKEIHESSVNSKFDVSLAVNFDGQSWSFYTSAKEDDDTVEQFFGKQNGDYYFFSDRISPDGSREKICRLLDEEDAEYFIAMLEGSIVPYFEWLEETIDLIEDSTSFECLKTTGETTTYQIKFIEGDLLDQEMYNITIEVKNGLITSYKEKGYITVTYTYNVRITLPDRAYYEMQ